MLRKIRLTFAMICFALITLLFLDFTGTLHGWFGWLAKIQFLPAVLALNVGVILFLVILTLVCGRIYCSVICPLGVFQDILAWLGRQPKKRRKLPSSNIKYIDNQLVTVIIQSNVHLYFFYMVLYLHLHIICTLLTVTN